MIVIIESMCVCMLSVLLLFISLVLPAANMGGGLVDYKPGMVGVLEY